MRLENILFYGSSLVAGWLLAEWDIRRKQRKADKMLRDAEKLLNPSPDNTEDSRNARFLAMKGITGTEQDDPKLGQF